QGAADGFPRERLRVEQRVIDEADCVIAECPQDEEDLTTLYRADARRIAQIPCGYDPEEMHPVAKRLARRIAGLPENGRLLLQLGRLVPRKGVDNVIRALGRLVHDHRLDARLAIVGGASEAPDDQATPEIERLRCVAKRERVESRVLFLGRKARERLKYYYSAADVFVSTPWYEPFGMTPLEAMACGRPVVGSDVGGIKSTVADGRTGHLVPVDDPRALAAVLARLYRHPLRLRSLGRRSLRRAARFTWTRVTDAVEKVYEEILSHGKIPTSRIYR
ncbi:MAG TPA: glycosyltransferase, partial [Elusimicrobiota bacterium]|nr:glycosyltransferase [Elusimicrobiota bacterium]